MLGAIQQPTEYYAVPQVNFVVKEFCIAVGQGDGEQDYRLTIFQESDYYQQVPRMQVLCENGVVQELTCAGGATKRQEFHVCMQTYCVLIDDLAYKQSLTSHIQLPLASAE